MDTNEDRKYEGLSLFQLLSLKSLERACASVHNSTGATLWFSAAFPSEDRDEATNTVKVKLMTFAIGCECEQCSKDNVKIVAGIQKLIEDVSGFKGDVIEGKVNGDTKLQLVDNGEKKDDHDIASH